MSRAIAMLDEPPGDLVDALAAFGVALQRAPEDAASLRGRIDGAYCLQEHLIEPTRVLAETLGVPFLSARQVALGRDKRAMKAALDEAGVPVARQAFLPRGAEPVPPLPYPFIVKPNLGFASCGVRLVEDDASFAEALRGVDRANLVLEMMASRNGVESGTLGTLCETYVEGPELVVDALTIDGHTRALLVTDRRFPGPGDFRDFVYRSHDRLGEEIGRRPDRVYRELEELVSKTLSALDVRWGPSHTELRYDVQRDRWTVLETALRVGGGGGLGHLHEALTGAPYGAHAARAACRMMTREELAALPTAEGMNGAWVVVPAARRGRIATVHGADAAERVTGIERVTLIKRAGERITPPPEGFDYFATVVVVGPALDLLVQRAVDEVRFDYA